MSPASPMTVPSAVSVLSPAFYNEPEVKETVLMIYAKNNNTNKDMNVSLKIIKDASNVNLRCPISSVDDTITKGRLELWMVCHKVNPAEDWGQFDIQFEVEEKIPEQTYFNS